MNDVNQVHIQNQTRQLLLHPGSGMGIGGANSNAMEPLHIEGLLPAFKQLLEQCGMVQMAASLLGIKGINNIKPNLEAIGIFGQFMANTPSMVTNAFQSSPNIFKNSRM